MEDTFNRHHRTTLVDEFVFLGVVIGLEAVGSKDQIQVERAAQLDDTS